MAFKVGDAVEWTSQAAGFSRLKRGVVVEVVPAGKYPVRKDGGLPRNHESYVVHAVAIGRKSGDRKAYYWPRVAALSPAKSEAA